MYGFSKKTVGSREADGMENVPFELKKADEMDQVSCKASADKDPSQLSKNDLEVSNISVERVVTIVEGPKIKATGMTAASLTTEIVFWLHESRKLLALLDCERVARQSLDLVARLIHVSEGTRIDIAN